MAVNITAILSTNKVVKCQKTMRKEYKTPSKQNKHIHTKPMCDTGPDLLSFWKYAETGWMQHDFCVFVHLEKMG